MAVIVPTVWRGERVKAVLNVSMLVAFIVHAVVLSFLSVYLGRHTDLVFKHPEHVSPLASPET